jgi:hypothetical protein
MTGDQASGGAGGAMLPPRTIAEGAVVSFRGDVLVESGDGIVAAVESRLTDAAASTRHEDGWLTDAVPVLTRGVAWIVPLAWVPDGDADDDASRRTLMTRATELWSAVRAACAHRHGEPIGMDLESPAGAQRRYADELVRTGARRADWWRFDRSAVVLVVYGRPLPSPLSRIAVHIVPAEWTSERPRSASKNAAIPDLGWSWADVVALGGAAGQAE